MHVKCRVLYIACSIFKSFLTPADVQSVAVPANITLAILPCNNIEITYKKFYPLLAYLKRETGLDVKLTVPNDFAESGQEVLRLVKKEDFDLIVLDITMPGNDGLETLAELKLLKPEIPVLVLSIYPEEQYAVRLCTPDCSRLRTRYRCTYLTICSRPESCDREAIQYAASRGKTRPQRQVCCSCSKFWILSRELPHITTRKRDYDQNNLISLQMW